MERTLFMRLKVLNLPHAAQFVLLSEENLGEVNFYSIKVVETN